MDLKSKAYLDGRRGFSDGIVSAIREGLLKEFSSQDDFAVITNGSYARREASKLSDIDFYLIKRSAEVLVDEEKVSKLISEHVDKPPSVGGAFNQVCLIEDFTKNVGGLDDNNSSMTRRLLMLLEGEWLYNESIFSEVRNNLVNFYVSDHITERQIALFLLNDIIRYYRTVCVDFNYKTVEVGKSWGVRNIKLAFSRKLFYFAGVIVVAETAHLTPIEKRAKLLELFSLSPLEVLRLKFGDEADFSHEMYADFLENISEQGTRANLELVEKSTSSDSLTYRSLKNLSHRFTDELFRLLQNGYGVNHPIHMTLVM